MYYTSKAVYELISHQTSDPIVERKTCSISGVQFPIFQSDLVFFGKVSPVFDGKKYEISLATICPEERQRQRLLFRNERKLYRRKCDASGKDIISIYAPTSPYKVYDQKIWRSDARNALSYGRDFDFKRTFTEQFHELSKDVPHVSLYSLNSENSEYSNYTLEQKNCYLVFGAGSCEDCCHGKFISYSKNSTDGLVLFSCEHCYEGTASQHCYKCSYFTNCRNCSNCQMIEDCTGCQDCACCFGLSDKQYYLYNKPVGKDAFQAFQKEHSPRTPTSINILAEKLEEIKKTVPAVAAHIYDSENCFGESIFSCKNCTFAYDVTDNENCKYIYFTPKSTDTQDCTFCSPHGVRLSYNVCSTVDLQHAISDFMVRYASDIYYCMECHNANNLFGCVGCTNTSYCIFNKQYPRQEYEMLAGKIAAHMQETGEWGPYLAPSLSNFAYNETIAQEYFPLTKGDALARGYIREDTSYDPAIPEGMETLAGDAIPEKITDVSDDMLKKIFVCEVSKRPYRIVKQELDFYRQHNIPLPRKHPDIRHEQRLKKHPAGQLHARSCDKCGKEIVSVYPSHVSPATEKSPDLIGNKGRCPEGGGVCNQQNIYCEACYTKEMYG